MSTPTLPRPAIPVAAPIDHALGGDNDTQPATVRAITTVAPPAGADTHPTKGETPPNGSASGGAQLAGRNHDSDTQGVTPASDQPTDRPTANDAHDRDAVGSDAGQDPAAKIGANANKISLLDPALALAADVLDDTERVLLANQNRLRQLTRTAEDSDGEVRGLGLDERHPDVARLGAIVDMLDKVTKDATKNLEKHMRRHPLHPWAKSIRGVGDKQIARLLAAVGDPYIRPEIVRDDGSVLPEGPRTVSALWAYCGLHVLPAGGQGQDGAHGHFAARRDQLPADQRRLGAQERGVGGVGGDPGHELRDPHRMTAGVAPKRARGQRANWSTRAKTRAYLIAESCMKQLRKPCAKADDAKWATHAEDCQCSPYRLVYDHRREHTAGTHPEWTDGHAQNDALRVVSKEILKDLWRAAKAWHESTDR